MFEYFVGLRYLLNRARISLSIISIISICGVFLGVMALVSVISVAGGFEDVFRDKVLGVNSHVLVMTYKQDDFREYREVQKKLESYSSDVLETAPFIFHEMMIAIGSKVSGILIKGVEPETMMGSVIWPNTSAHKTTRRERKYSRNFTIALNATERFRRSSLAACWPKNSRQRLAMKCA